MYLYVGGDIPRDGRSRFLGARGVTGGVRDGVENTRKFVRSNSVPNHNTCQGLETPGGYSLSQNDVGNRSGEFRTPQSTRCGAKIAGMGGRDWGLSDPACVGPLLSIDSVFKANAGERITAFSIFVVVIFLWVCTGRH